jgi:hypothetical protein
LYLLQVVEVEVEQQPVDLQVVVQVELMLEMVEVSHKLQHLQQMDLVAEAAEAIQQ